MTDQPNARLAVRYDEGRGPVVVLLHGINGTAADWRPVINHIGPGYRCIAVDLLGFGDSPRPAGAQYTADEHVAALEATLRGLGIGEKFLLVGYQLGGDVAVRYAATYPERLRRLFLFSTPYYLPSEARESRRSGTAFLSESIFNAVWKSVGRRKKRRGVVYEIDTGRLEDYARAFIRDEDTRADWDVISKNLTNTIAKTTFIDDLPALTMPAEFVLGVRDAVVRPDQSSALVRLKPDLRVRHIFARGADHFLLANRPELVADLILASEVRTLAVPFREGLGEPTVLLHDVSAGSKRWEPVAKALSMRSEVATIDLLGFGESPAPTQSGYFLEDHVAAVLNTLDVQFPGRRVRLVGSGLGALVALGCGATRPTSVSQVVAFAPPLVPPGLDPALAVHPAITAITEKIDDRLQQARQGLGALDSPERAARRILPAVRSLQAALATDASLLVSKLTMPARIIEPAPARPVPREWLRELIAENPDVELLEPETSGDIAFDRPAEALTLIGGVTEAQIFAAASASPVSDDRRDIHAAILGTHSGLLFRRAALALIAAIALAVPGSRDKLVSSVLPLWLLVEAAVTALGALGLKRSGRSWKPWLAMTAVSAVFAAVLGIMGLLGATVGAALLGTWLLLRGLVSILSAWRIRESGVVRAALSFEAIFALVSGLLLVSIPALGTLQPFVLMAFFALSGLASLACAWLIARDAKAVVERLVAPFAESEPAESAPVDSERVNETTIAIAADIESGDAEATPSEAEPSDLEMDPGDSEDGPAEDDPAGDEDPEDVGDVPDALELAIRFDDEDEDELLIALEDEIADESDSDADGDEPGDTEDEPGDTEDGPAEADPAAEEDPLDNGDEHGHYEQLELTDL